MRVSPARSHGSSARKQLIETQRTLVARARKEIEGSLHAQPRELVRYQEEYDSHLADHAGPLTHDDLVAALEAVEIIYFGDYHTLRESQKAPLRIIEALRRSGRDLVLASEVVHIVHQDLLDQYLGGKLEAPRFLDAIDYSNTWGFSWRNHGLLFEYAREHELPVLALNSDPTPDRDSLAFRDEAASLVVAEACRRHPGAVVAVIFGDLHVAPEHLPDRVAATLSRRGLPSRKRAIVYQNAESIYWDLVEQGLEQETEAVRIDEESYCLLNSTPLVKFHSYQNWEANLEELEESPGLEGRPQISSNFMTEQVLARVRSIVDFLELKVDGFDDFTVHTSRDLDFLDKLAAAGDFSPEELEDIRLQIARDESYFVPRHNIIYLGNLSMDDAAEEATHYLNTKLAGHVDEVPDRRFDFYYRVIKEAVGFFGSRIANHKRTCHRRSDFEEILTELKGRRLRGRAAALRRIATDVITHMDYEDRWLKGEETGYPRFRSLFRRDVEVHIGITHSLGYILGDRMYDALMAGQIRRNEVRHFFRQTFDAEHPPQECYFDWVDYLGWWRRGESQGDPAGGLADGMEGRVESS